MEGWDSQVPPTPGHHQADRQIQTLYNSYVRLWLSGSSNNLKVGGLIPTLTAPNKGGELIAGGLAVHLLGTAGVPLSKTPYLHALRALWMAAHHSSVWHLSPWVCDPVHVCVPQVLTWMGQMRRSNFVFFVWQWLHDNKVIITLCMCQMSVWEVCCNGADVLSRLARMLLQKIFLTSVKCIPG